MTISFADGERISSIGLGTWPMDDAEAERVVAEAIDIGYRLLDTAMAYGNETGVGRGVRGSGAAREDVFITTKFNKRFHSVAGVASAFAESARHLQVDYLDLMLIHWPVPAHGRYVDAWEGLIALQEQGKVRHIGTSNFLPEHLERIISATGVAPALNQLQINPRYLQTSAREFDRQHGIVTQSWSPLGRGSGLLQQPPVVEVAERVGCTPAQAVLAWHLAVGMCTVPKSSDSLRLRQNLEAQHIRLDPADVQLLSSLDGTEPEIMHPNVVGH